MLLANILVSGALLFHVGVAHAVGNTAPPPPWQVSSCAQSSPYFKTATAACASSTEQTCVATYDTAVGTFSFAYASPATSVSPTSNISTCYYNTSNYGVVPTFPVGQSCNNTVGATLTAPGTTSSTCTCGSSFYQSYTQSCEGATLIGQHPGSTKNNGPQCPNTCVGDPINAAIGNNWLTETDFSGGNSASGLSFARTYNSNAYSTDAGLLRSIGAQWTQTYDLKAVPIVNPQQTLYYLPQCYQWDNDLQIFCIEPPLTTTSTAVNGVNFVRPDGKTFSFGLVGGTWVGDADVSDKVTSTFASDGVTITGWTYVTANGDQTEQYDGNGNLLTITSRAGVVQTMTYSNGSSNDTSTGRYPANAPVCSNVEAGAVVQAGLLLCVTDTWGHQIQFEYDANNRVSKMINPNNQATMYAYDGPSGGCTAPGVTPASASCSANNLTQVTYPDGSIKTYWYNEAAQINGASPCQGDTGVGAGFGDLLNSLTSIVDENGSRYTSWNYDCTGRAISSQLVGNLRQTALSYGSPNTSTGASTTTTTDTVGNPANPQVNIDVFGYQMLFGVSKLNTVSNPCTGCGNIASYTYDANGNVASTVDFNGNVTNYTYDLTRNLEISRVEAYGTALSRTITTQWHPTYHLPTLITEPGRTTTLVYDGNGNLLTKTISAGGNSRTWSYTYNSVGQVLTATGPRSDVVELTRFSYDANGNLSTVTNPVGLVTTLSNYDANGRVGLITDPNGTTAALSYSSRGWLTSKVVTAGSIVQSTSYTYDNAGQLVNVTLPDGSSIGYTYDPAHRLTNVKDNLGDSINYTLDLWGNRMNETVTDPNGVLTRQISRVYDTVNRLQQATGAAQ